MVLKTNRICREPEPRAKPRPLCQSTPHAGERLCGGPLERLIGSQEDDRQHKANARRIAAGPPGNDGLVFGHRSALRAPGEPEDRKGRARPGHGGEAAPWGQAYTARRAMTSEGMVCAATMARCAKVLASSVLGSRPARRRPARTPPRCRTQRWRCAFGRRRTSSAGSSSSPCSRGRMRGGHADRGRARARPAPTP